VFGFVQSALTPNSDVVLKASIWMEKYFNLHCAQPHLGEKEIHLEAGTEKMDVWKEYVAAMKFQFKCADAHLDYAMFVKVWNTAYSHVKILDHKACSTKCMTCHEIHRCAINAEDKAVYDAAKKLHQMLKSDLQSDMKYLMETTYNRLKECTNDPLFDELNRWKIVLYPNWDPRIGCYESLAKTNNSQDSGIYLLLSIDFIYNDLPLLFKAADVSTFRQAYCYYLILNDLPS